MRRGIAAAVGMRVDSVEAPQGRLRPLLMEPPLQELADRVCGGFLEAAERYGKRIALRLAVPSREGDQVASCQHWLVIEPRMTGLLLVAEPPTQEHVRLRLSGTCRRGLRQELLFWDRRGLGTIRLVDAVGLQQLCGPSRLGPDALTIESEAFVARLRSSARAVKVALLDQRAVAGIGNLYAAEMLFLAGIDPRVRCRQLSRPRWKRLHAVMQEVLAEAVELEGSTLSDATYRTALNEPGRYQARHRVYGREGQPCPVCGTAVRRIIQSQRSTFFCPQCQRR
jgi:formamidopyrimidine-DNA glycosylase